MHIRTASLADAAALAAVEAACFPPAEAATAAEITDRLAYYADHFWLLEEDDGTPITVTIFGSCSMKISSLPL